MEAFPWDEAPTYLLRDRDSVYGVEFHHRVQQLWDRRGTNRPALTLAESLCRTIDRLDSA